MEEKNMQKREKSSAIIKIINTVVCIGIAVSVCINVYQYKESSTLRSEIVALQSEMETLKTDRDTLNKEVETKQYEESDLSKQIEDLQKKIEKLEADNQSLADSLKDLEDEQLEDNADIDEDYVSSIDDVVDKVLAEYYRSNPAPTTAYQGPHVGTPSTGELPGKLELDGDYSQYQGATVY